MKKAFLSGVEFIDFIVSLIGIIGFLVTVNEFQYRWRPDLTVLITSDEFKEIAQGGNDRPFIEQIIKVQMDYIYHNDRDAVIGLTQIIQDHPQFTIGYYSRGLMYLSAGYIDAGVTDLQMVIKQSVNPELRQNAIKEIIMARAAQVSTPLAVVGIFGMAMLFILIKAGMLAKAVMKDSPWARPTKALIIIIMLLFGVSLFYLGFH